MEFLSPLFWFAAAAVAIPIFLHLVQKEKKDRIPFASLMFMPRLPIKQLRRRHLKHLLLLFLRCLAVLLLVMAFSRPIATGAWFDRINPLTAHSVVILLDHSMSMTRPGVWDAALQAAQDRVRSLDDGDEGIIIQFDEAGEVLSQWQESPEKLREGLSRITRSYRGTSYNEGLRLAADQFEGEHNALREIYLITDLQRNGLTSTQGWKVPEGITVELKDVSQESDNLFVDEARIDRDVYGKAYPNPVLLRLATSPPRPVQGEAQLFVEGKLLDRQSFELNDEGTGQLTFKAFDLDDGVSRGKIVITPDDILPEDNNLYFVVERRQPRKLLIVSSQSRNPSLYLENALGAGTNRPFEIEVTKSPRSSDLTPDLTPLVILDGLPQPPAVGLFESYVREGGGLILVLGKDIQPEDYNSRWLSLLPAKILDRHFVRSSKKPFTALTQVRWDHPVFSIFQDVHKASIVGAQFYSYWNLEAGAGSEVLARFDEGDPALVETTHGKGRILLFASSSDPVWTDFPLRSSYLPFWQRLADYASRLDANAAFLRAGQILAAPAGEKGSAGQWNAIDPAGKRILGLDDRQPLSLQLNLPGHYEVRENKGTDWIAVNTLPLESDLTQISADEFQAVFVPAGSRPESLDSKKAAGASREKQQSLWWLCLIAAGLILILESVLANRQKVQSV